MCLFDVKRAKRFETNQAVDDDTPDFNVAQALPANANRVRVLITARWEAPVGDDDAVEWRVGSNSGPVVGLTTKYQPNTVLRLEDIGAAVGQTLFRRKFGAANINVTYTEIIQDVPDDKV